MRLAVALVVQPRLRWREVVEAGVLERTGHLQLDRRLEGHLAHHLEEVLTSDDQRGVRLLAHQRADVGRRRVQAAASCDEAAASQLHGLPDGHEAPQRRGGARVGERVEDQRALVLVDDRRRVAGAQSARRADRDRHVVGRLAVVLVLHAGDAQRHLGLVCDRGQLLAAHLADRASATVPALPRQPGRQGLLEDSADDVDVDGAVHSCGSSTVNQ